jgi:hypothetical protein
MPATLMPFGALLPVLVISFFVPAAILGWATAVQTQRKVKVLEAELERLRHG